VQKVPTPSVADRWVLLVWPEYAHPPVFVAVVDDGVCHACRQRLVVKNNVAAHQVEGVHFVEACFCVFGADRFVDADFAAYA